YDSDSGTGQGLYENSDIGGNYLGFQSADNETDDTYLITATYSTEDTLSELSDFSNPENLGAYSKFCFQDSTPSPLPIDSLNSDSYFYIQIPNQPNDIWYRYNDGDWKKVQTYTDVTGGDKPNYTYKVVISDLTLSKAGTNCLEFAGDNGSGTLPVVLSTFVAQYMNNQAELYWQTQTESDNVGWYVYRNNTVDYYEAECINNEIIDGYGTTTEPHEYTYTDNTIELTPEETYYYWIESLDLSGKSNVHGPAELYVSPDEEPGNTPGNETINGLHNVMNNPFNPAFSNTSISFSLPQKSQVELNIFNIKGQIVRNLYSGVAKENEDCIWNGTDENGVMQSAGIYLYALKVNGKIHDTQKIILMK
ncbi:MAG: T9SS type A sorting domain-containing protein, partial [Candidatus Cloacimonetes bacterium]|nr:T9SS type A sorting domain-containing protein [Candidatus Cloacimonadota bacterium]